MRHYHYQHSNRPFPFGWMLFGFVMLFLFGWKLFLILPLLMLLGGCWAFGGANRSYRYLTYDEDGYGKPKRKTHYEDDDEVTYV